MSTPLTPSEPQGEPLGDDHLDDDAVRMRRCIVTGAVLPDSALIRFVAGPEGEIVPDLAGKLPGRGLWVSARRDVLEKAIAKKSFARAQRGPVNVGADLAKRVETVLIRRMTGDLGLARRTGALVLGFDNVMRALDGRIKPALLVEASDGAADGRRKLLSAARGRGQKIAVMDCLTRAELCLALGRENVIHAALTPGVFAQRLQFEAGRLSGFRTGGDLTAGSGVRAASRTKVERVRPPRPTKGIYERH